MIPNRKGPLHYIWFIGLVFYSCQDHHDPILTQIENVEFELVTLDEVGNEATVFVLGTDVTLVLKVTNNSGNDFLWNLENTCSLMFHEDFYTIHRLNEQEGSSDGATKLGKPYIFPIDACTFVNLPPIQLGSGINYLIKIPWSENNSSSLPIGRYFSQFSYNLRIDKDLYVPLSLRVEFKIE